MILSGDLNDYGKTYLNIDFSTIPRCLHATNKSDVFCLFIVAHLLKNSMTYKWLILTAVKPDLKGQSLCSLNTGQILNAWLSFLFCHFTLFFTYPKTQQTMLFLQEAHQLSRPYSSDPHLRLFHSCSYCSRQLDEQKDDRKQRGIGSTALWSPLIVLLCARQQWHAANKTCFIRAVESLIFVMDHPQRDRKRTRH